MLSVLTGSSGAGKSTLAAAVAARVPDLVVRDTDEYGVPSHADTAWRQAELERWVQRALAVEASGGDVLLSGQSPLGELLAAPSAPALRGIAVCLVDVSDDVRRERLHARNPGVWDEDAVVGFNRWGDWHRRHAADPRFEPEVLRDSGWPAMRWERWASWGSGDPRWRTHRLATTGQALEASVSAVERWIRAERRLVQSGAHPLAR
jgi:hypothetical protein